MLHNLREEKILLIERKRFEQQCKVLDAADPSHIKADSGMDYWGDPIPAPQLDPDGCMWIPVYGVMYGGMPSIYCRYGFCDPWQISAWLSDAEANAQVKKIMLDISSPGGVTTGVPELAAKILAIQQNDQKPIGAFSDSGVFSAAFWIAAGATAILGTPSSDWGNIGSYTTFLNTSAWQKALGVATELFTSGTIKGIGETGDLTPAQRDFLQSRVAHTANMFKSDVAGSREIDVTDMEGQWYKAQEAMDRGFIDVVVADRAEAKALLR